MDEMWTCDDLSGLMTMFILANKKKQCKKSVVGLHAVADHYNIGNGFYKLFLTDPFMAYTCGFFLNPDDTLASAQMNKVNMVVKKLTIGKGDRVLDIGCGWGGIAKYIQDSTGADLLGITIAKEQLGFTPGVKTMHCVATF
jgi:cyclopropane-fatty-acyl-phospholipid synthase